MNRKRMSLVLALAALLVLAVFGWLVPLSRNSQAAPAPSGDATMKGKVLLVHTNNMMRTFLLEKTHVQKIGDRSFLVGKGAADGRMAGWYKERTVRLQMEHIVSITEFDDLKDAKEALKSGGGMIGIGGGAPVYAAPAVVPADSPAPAPIPAAVAPPAKRQ